MKKTKTSYDTLKARITVRGSQFNWSIVDDGGQLMAAGTEHRLSQAFDVAYEAVTGVRLWMPFARGSITPVPDGSRYFTFDR